MNVRTLEQEPLANAYLQELQQEERTQQSQTLTVPQITLANDGRLSAGGQSYDLSEEAQKDLANLAHIPVTYFSNLDPELRAINFNHRLPGQLTQDERLAIVSNGSVVLHIRRHDFFRVPHSRAVEAVLEAAPPNAISNGIHAVEYHRNGHLDMALVSRALVTEPRPNDIVCGGLHLTIEETGALQVGAVNYRLVCSNGAMARVCLGEKGPHRLRRGDGTDSERKFMTALREFAQSAWGDWARVAEGLESLTEQSLDTRNVVRLLQRIRQRPFFISAEASRRVLTRLAGREDLLTLPELVDHLAGRQDLTMYDLHNAITAVGSHDDNVLPGYRYRLRLGAGSLARGRVGICHECQQLILG